MDEFHDNLFYIMDTKNDVEIKEITEAEYDEKELKLNYETESVERVSDTQQNHRKSITAEDPLQLHLQVVLGLVFDYYSCTWVYLNY